MELKTFLESYRKIRPLVLCGILASALYSLNELSEIFEPIEDNVVTIDQVPSRIELNVGRWENDKIGIKINTDTYVRLVNAPRSVLSQFDAKRLVRDTPTLKGLSRAIIDAGPHNFMGLISETYKIDNFNKRDYGKDTRRFVPQRFQESDYVRFQDFVRANVEYKKDGNDGKSGVGQYPIETLVLGHGDCEDQTYLTAGLLQYTRKVGWIYTPNEGDNTNNSAHMSLGIRLRDNEELPFAIIFDHTRYLDLVLKKLDAKEIPESGSITDLYDLMFEKHPELIIKKQYPATFEYKEQKYFVLETTGDGFYYREELPEGYKFNPIN